MRAPASYAAPLAFPFSVMLVLVVLNGFLLCVIQICGISKEISCGRRDIGWWAQDSNLHYMIECVEFDIEWEIFSRWYTKSIPGVDYFDINGASWCERSSSMVVRDNLLGMFSVIN